MTCWQVHIQTALFIHTLKKEVIFVNTTKTEYERYDRI